MSLRSMPIRSASCAGCGMFGMVKTSSPAGSMSDGTASSRKPSSSRGQSLVRVQSPSSCVRLTHARQLVTLTIKTFRLNQSSVMQLVRPIAFLLPCTALWLWGSPCAGQADSPGKQQQAADTELTKQFRAHAKEAAADYDFRGELATGRNLELCSE